MAKENKRILIVDDEVAITTMIAEWLDIASPDYLVDVCNDSMDALEKARTTAYDLIITDFQMPKMSGITLAQHIRKISPATQVIMMTAYATDKLHEVIGSLQLDGYIEKPLRLNLIHDIVQDALERTQEGDDAYRSGERVVTHDVAKPLQELQVNTAARAILLLSGGGYLIEMAGEDGGLDVSSICALVAANFMATSELARLLGDNSVFKSSYHEGPSYNIYAYRINEDVLLAVIFGTESKSGLVRYYAKKTAVEILPLLGELEKTPEGFQLEDGYSDSVGDELDELFG